MQRHRTVRVEHALRVAGRARGVTQRRRLALVQLRVDALPRPGRLEQLLVAQDPRQIAGWPVAHHDEVLDVFERRCEGRQRRRERVVDEDDAILGVVDHVGDLLGEQPQVDRVQNRADARNREVALEVALRVPREGPDPLAARDTKGAQGARQPVDPLDDLAVAGARDALVGERDDLAAGGE